MNFSNEKECQLVKNKDRGQQLHYCSETVILFEQYEWIQRLISVNVMIKRSVMGVRLIDNINNEITIARLYGIGI